LRPESAGLEPADLAGHLRIVALGDSITHGVDLPAEQTYPALLAERLRPRLAGRRVTVVNAGICGQTAVQGLGRLERDVLRFRPALTLISFGLNDASPTRSEQDVAREAELLPAGPAAWLGRLHLYRTLRARGRRLVKSLCAASVGWGLCPTSAGATQMVGQSRHPTSTQMVGQSRHPTSTQMVGQSRHPTATQMVGQSRHPTSTQMVGQSPHPTSTQMVGQSRHPTAMQMVGQSPHPTATRTPPAAFQAALTEMVRRIRRETGGQVVLLTTHLAGGYNAIIRQVAGETGAGLADVERAFAGRDLAGLLEWDGVHLTAEGQRLLAEAVFSNLAKVFEPSQGC